MMQIGLGAGAMLGLVKLWGATILIWHKHRNSKERWFDLEGAAIETGGMWFGVIIFVILASGLGMLITGGCSG